MEKQTRENGSAGAHGAEPTVPALNAPDAVSKAHTALRVPSRNPTVRRRVRAIAPFLGFEPTPGDIFALTRWAHLYEKWRSLGEQLDAQGDVRADKEPKRLLSEWVRLSGELRSLEQALGLTAAARASLGVSIATGRAMDLAALMGKRGTE